MENDERNLLERVERLERVVDGLLERDPGAREALSEGARLTTGTSAASPPVVPRVAAAPAPAATPPAPPAAPAPRTASTAPDLRAVLRVIGIALLLFGVAFLFKFSRDESHAIHVLRVAIGVGLGLALIVIGRALLSRDRPFAQILTGGGIAVWYMSGFAAFQLFGLVTTVPAFAYMAVVTVAAFSISIRQNSIPLAMVATIGGLATPFLLYDANRSVAGVAVYVAVVAATAVAVYRRRDWWALVWTAAVGSAWAVGATSVYYIHAATPDSQRWALEGSLLFLFMLFALATAGGYKRAARAGKAGPDYEAHLFLVLLIPIATIVLTYVIWKMTQHQVGQLCVAFAFVYVGATIAAYPRDELKRLTNAYLIVAASLAAAGALALIHGDMQHLAIATEALALRALYRRSGVVSADAVSHGLFVLTALLVVRDLTNPTPPAVPLFNRVGVTTLWSIAAGTTAAMWLPGGQARFRRGYLYVAHALILGWILRQFAAVSNGQAIVTIVWGVYGASLMVQGLRRTIRPMRTVGLLTLLAVVVKLFMVDLASVPAIWRVLLFIGFGGVFLALSYWFLSLDRSARDRKRAG
jgi:uncharacterized membrane protein